MKINFPSVHKIIIRTSNIFSIEKAQITAINNSGEFTLDNGGTVYKRVKCGSKYLYIEKSDNTTGPIQIPGMDIKLPTDLYCFVPCNPDEDEWEREDIQILVNTYRLRVVLEQSKIQHQRLIDIIKQRPVTILDKHFSNQQLNKHQLTLEKLMTNLANVYELTGVNY